MLKGVLEMCILAIIGQEETYGYELMMKLTAEGFDFVSEGSIYPLLLRLQKEGLIKGVMRDSPAGPQRKYYHLTEQGKRALQELSSHWQAIKNATDHILRKE
jgi:PadR family transcriptional regulator PadR